MAHARRSWRQQLRRGLDRTAQLSGVLQWYERRMRRQPTLLMYHRVLPAAECRDYPFGSLVMPAEAFAEQVRWLAEHTHVVTAAASTTAEPTARPLLAITFDDGYADNFEVAAPILERHGLRATFYVATDFVATGKPLWYDRAALLTAANSDATLLEISERLGLVVPLPEHRQRDRVDAWVECLKRTPSATRAQWLDAANTANPPASSRNFRPMQPGQLAELAQRGHEIGAHSVHHEILPLLDDRALADELQKSRAQVAAWIGTDVPGFCYPNGSHDDRVVRATQDAGFAYACTTQDPSECPSADPFRRARIDMNPSRVTTSAGAHDALAFRAEISGLHARLR